MTTTTTQPSLNCLDEDRRAKTRAAGWNGIDYLEVSDDQLHLDMYFLGRAPTGLAAANIVISGGRRVTGIQAVRIRIRESDDPRFDDFMEVTVDKMGDFSTYQLCLVQLDENGRPTDEPLAGFDPRYACLDFGFKAGCPSGLDCKPVDLCPVPERTEPEIDYLARDYPGMRTLILDRMSLLLPDWCERHVPDLGITLVELLAYAGDRLSYFQDAIATEAYLDTARQRVSVKRHARLVDYWMHEGNNARAWVCITADTELLLDLEAICLVAADLATSKATMTLEDFELLPESSRQAFEPVIIEETEFRVRPAHNRLRFYTWGDGECCLPTGATSATFLDSWVAPDHPVKRYPDNDVALEPPATYQRPGPGDSYGGYGASRGDGGDGKYEDDSQPIERGRALDLSVGDVIIFEEVIGPKTGNPADADRSHRHAVCITDLHLLVDPICDEPVVEISWAIEDALPFPLCISTRGPAPDCVPLEDVSVACGNVLLVDHGLTCDQGIGKVPTESTDEVCGDECCPPQLVLTPGKFRPWLDTAPVTSCEPLSTLCPAAAALLQDPRLALHHVGVTQLEADAPGAVVSTDSTSVEWTIVHDLLACSGEDPHFVVEVDNHGRASLRFGDGQSGRIPAACSEFSATYRVGNGIAGNVGAEAINRIVFKTAAQSGAGLQVRNPLAAVGGQAPETLDDVKLFAPHAFRRVLARAVTAEDYASIVERDFSEVQRAAASLVFTGSHTEVMVAIDQRGATEPETTLLVEVASHLERYRRIGHDVVVVPAVHVPLDVAVLVCVDSAYLRAHVEVAVRLALGTSCLVDGTLGFFHPDRLSFGEGIFSSLIVAAIQPLDGVASVQVTRLERLFEGPNGELEAGVLETGPTEVVRVDNDPSLPENGRLTIDMRGGR